MRIESVTPLSAMWTATPERPESLRALGANLARARARADMIWQREEPLLANLIRPSQRAGRAR